MQISYGNYPFLANGVKWTDAIQTQVVNYVPTLQTISVNLEGRLEVSGAADAARQLAVLQAALWRPGLDLVMRGSNGVVIKSLRSGGSVSGVVCVAGPDCYEAMGPQYETVIDFRVTFQAVYQVEAGKPLVYDYVQTLSVEEGGPVYVFQPAVRGPAKKVLTQEMSTWTATQSGQATGLIAYPLRPAPIFGRAHIIGKPSWSTATPTRVGNGLTGFPCRWDYRFESVTPLVGSPGLPP